MNINEQRVAGTFQIKQMGASETEGERKRPNLKVKVCFATDPAFVDRYLDGHGSGAQPSSVFWREYPDQAGAKFIRYGALGRCELAIPPDTRRYVLKITTKPPEGTEADSDDYFGYREFLVPKAVLKKAQFEVAAKSALVSLIFDFTCLHEHENLLTALRLEPEVLIGVWNEQGELFDEQNNPNVQAAKDEDDDEDEDDEDRDEDEEGDSTPKPTDDAALAREAEMERAAESTGIGSDLE